MSERFRGWYFWIAATLLTAILVHLGTIYALPRLVMARVLAKIGPADVMQFPKRPDATARGIVMPSPDLLYSACAFDLSKGPLRVVARVPHSTYWSVSAFDANTNNFFVRNDRQIDGDAIELLLLKRGMAFPNLDNALERVIVFAPTDKGLILTRLLIDDEKHLAALDALRRNASCNTVHPVATAPRLR